MRGRASDVFRVAWPSPQTRYNGVSHGRRQDLQSRICWQRDVPDQQAQAQGAQTPSIQPEESAARLPEVLRNGFSPGESFRWEDRLVSNSFVHAELNTTDVAKAKAFYGKFFEGTLQDTRIGDLDYTMIKVGKGTGGGMMKQLIPGAGSAWLPYVLVDDIKISTKK